MLNEKFDSASCRWDYKRMVFDHIRTEQLTAVGVAIIGHQYYNETGRWVGQSSQQDTIFYQHYNLKHLAPNLIQVFFDFAESQLFFEIVLDRPKNHINHVCGADHYQGYWQSICDVNPARFYISWYVLGPRKNYVMKTFYRKQC